MGFFKLNSKFFRTKRHEIRQTLMRTRALSGCIHAAFLFLFADQKKKRNIKFLQPRESFHCAQTCCVQSRFPHCVRAQCQTNIFNAFSCLMKHLSNISLCSNQHCLHLLVLAGGLLQSICIQSSTVSAEEYRITGGIAFAIIQHIIHTTERNLNASSVETLQGICFFIYRRLLLVITLVTCTKIQIYGKSAKQLLFQKYSIYDVFYGEALS